MTVGQFSTAVWRHYRLHGRHTLPWRRSHNPYRILVSEVMLQQTQVDRVVPFYRAFLRKFPTARALATASLGDVLRAWQGLGYNRRAKMLHDAAKVVMQEHGGRVPKDAAQLVNLPGVGPYTASAVAAFAGNADEVFIETNIRTAVIHHFFSDERTIIYDSADIASRRRGGARKGTVTDKDILHVLKRAHPKGRAREWYAALMDYGAFLKRDGVRVNRRSKSYTRQTAFTGSLRQVRGAILRALSKKPCQKKTLLALFPRKRSAQVETSLQKLVAEGLVVKQGRGYCLP